ncbi:hypothetical protein KSP40_PGU015032 [Platanthera guangdongensis]|uniref:Uncharacterized protein n=1 Tax=Platanthera guangdongensis TaxID=2320717 RepID=A0ABR2LJJ3_9ASPA
MMMLLDPVGCLTNLLYLGYKDDYVLAFHIIIQRRQDLERQQSQRNVLQCFVFGPKNVEKSSLLSLLIGRGTKKTLVMREIPEDSVKKLLSNKESLAAYDIVVFVRDNSDVNSFNKATEMLIQVATKGKIVVLRYLALLFLVKMILIHIP